MKESLTINLNGSKRVLNKYDESNRPVDIINNKKQILSVISNKGGVGKTSIACCASLYFSKVMKKKTLLLELDCSPGDFGTLFDIDMEMSLEMAIRFQREYKKYIKSINSNLDVLKGISDPIIAENIKSDAVNSFIKIIIEEYDYIIIDTQTVLSGVLLDFFRVSNMFLVISDSTMESVARVSNFLDILNSRFMIDREKFKIIINKKKFFSFLHIWEISKILNFPIESLIYFDRKFNKSHILLNEHKILRTKFFKQICKTLENIDMEHQKC
ncbi:MAG: AAA family ATPase [Actinomycetia bacterium]|nr:AAA family ATPase [Actinomycetes bacterium]